MSTPTSKEAAKSVLEERIWLTRKLYLVGTVAVAFAALVIEDATLGFTYPSPLDHMVTEDISVGLIIAWVVRLGCLIWLTVVALKLIKKYETFREQHGTLYYLQYLAESMSDTHQIPLGHAITEHEDANLIAARWSGSVDPAVDMVDDVILLGRELQRELNTDSPTTGFHLAPNLLYPASLGLGYALMPWPRTTLREFDLDKPRAGEVPDQPFDWSVPTGWTTSSELTMHADSDADVPAGAPILISLNATSKIFGVRQPRPGQPQPAWPARKYFLWHRASAENEQPSALTVEPGAIPRTDLYENKRRLICAPEILATTCVLAIRQALHAHPTSQIYVTAQLPKTVAVMAGWLLRESLASARFPYHPCSGDSEILIGGYAPCEACARPWERLVPLYALPPVHPLFPCRVYPTQPSREELAAKWAVDSA